MVGAYVNGFDQAAHHREEGIRADRGVSFIGSILFCMLFMCWPSKQKLFCAYAAYANREYASDMWIIRNVPGGLNSPLGEALDNYLGGNPNPSYGQIVGGAPGVGGYGYPQYGSSFGYYM
ncbi:unnamed protein product [Adineta ricciae]|uniref:Uncharacterized protein n=1 Tax=Adineta ricciae TaxID=249248 RepID=A0A814FQ31_ADIRI|nr:unnamed protein product [Adineta ricciae]